VLVLPPLKRRREKLAFGILKNVVAMSFSQFMKYTRGFIIVLGMVYASTMDSIGYIMH
jgi:hypothetical protein